MDNLSMFMPKVTDDSAAKCKGVSLEGKGNFAQSEELPFTRVDL